MQQEEGQRKRRSLTADVVLTFGSKVGVLVLTAAAGVVVARALGPTGRGAIAAATALSLLFVQFGILGLHSANTYFASRSPDQIPRILVNTLWSAFALGLLLAGIGIALRELSPSSVRGLDLTEVIVVLAGVPAILAIQLLQGLLLAEGRMIAYNGLDLGAALGTTIGLAVALLAFSGGVLAALTVLLGVNVAGALAVVMLLRHDLKAPRAFDSRLFLAMVRYGFRLYLAALLAYLAWRTNVLLVNSYLGSSAAGQFSIAVALGETIHLLPTVVALNLFPRIARGDELSDTGSVFRSLTLVYGLGCIALIPILGPVIRLLYGNAFAGAIGISYWLLPGMFAYGMVSVLSYHFAGRGFPLRVLTVWVIGVIVNFGIAFPLLARHSRPATAAVAISVAYLVILALHMRMFAAESGGWNTLIPKPRETGRLVVATVRALSVTR